MENYLNKKQKKQILTELVNFTRKHKKFFFGECLAQEIIFGTLSGWGIHLTKRGGFQRCNSGLTYVKKISDEKLKGTLLEFLYIISLHKNSTSVTREFHRDVISLYITARGKGIRNSHLQVEKRLKQYKKKRIKRLEKEARANRKLATVEQHKQEVE